MPNSLNNLIFQKGLVLKSGVAVLRPCRFLSASCRCGVSGLACHGGLEKSCFVPRGKGAGFYKSGTLFD